MIVLGYAAQSKADKQYAAFQMLSIILLIPCEELTR